MRNVLFLFKNFLSLIVNLLSTKSSGSTLFIYLPLEILIALFKDLGNPDSFV